MNDTYKMRLRLINTKEAGNDLTENLPGNNSTSALRFQRVGLPKDLLIFGNFR